MDSPAEKFFGALLALSTLALFTIAVVIDEDFPWQVAIPLEYFLGVLAVLGFSYAGFLAATCFEHRRTVAALSPRR